MYNSMLCINYTHSMPSILMGYNYKILLFFAIFVPVRYICIILCSVFITHNMCAISILMRYNNKILFFLLTIKNGSHLSVLKLKRFYINSISSQ